MLPFPLSTQGSRVRYPLHLLPHLCPYLDPPHATFTWRHHGDEFMVRVVCAGIRLFTAGIPALGIHFGDRPRRLHLCPRLALRAKVLEPGRVTMGPGPRGRGIAVVTWTRVVSAAVPGADARAPPLEAANHEVLSVWKVGADES